MRPGSSAAACATRSCAAAPATGTSPPPPGPGEVERLFRRTVPTGARHGTVTVLYGGGHCEVTTYRTEGAYTDRRRPDSVSFTTSLEADLSRRDFTINAMAMDAAGRVTDPFGGRADLARGLIRCVGEPERRFGEDALRLLRCLRFASRLGFEIDAATLAALRSPRAADGLAERRARRGRGFRHALVAAPRRGLSARGLGPPLRQGSPRLRASGEGTRAAAALCAPRALLRVAGGARKYYVYPRLPHGAPLPRPQHQNRLRRGGDNPGPKAGL